MNISMTKPLCALMLCAAAASTWAQDPARHIEAQGFTLDVGGNPESLLSDSAGIARISLTNAGNALQLDPNQFVLHGDSRFYGGVFTVNVRPGYQVTAISWSGNFVGDLRPFVGPPGECCFANGSASNYGEFLLGVSPQFDPGMVVATLGASVANLNGTQGVGNGAALSLQGSFGLLFDARVEVYVEGGARLPSPEFPRHQNIPSYAGLGLADAVLTIHTSPVPEPASWAMLLGGLGALAVMRRRTARSTAA